MALLHVDFFSDVLGMCVEMDVILPENTVGQIGMEGKSGPDKWKTLYLLHGMSDDHTIWQRRTSIERYVSDKGIAVVMPSTQLGWYTDMYEGMKWYTYIAEELIDYVRRVFPVTKMRVKTFAAGLSMGGYGALKLTLRWPERFAACGALSGAADIYARFALGDRHDQGVAIWGEDYLSVIPGSQDDTYHLTRKLETENKPKPWIYQACGLEDKRLGENHLFRDFIRDRGFVYEYFEGPGRHNWDFWNQQIVPVLDFFVRCMEENGGR